MDIRPNHRLTLASGLATLLLAFGSAHAASPAPGQGNFVDMEEHLADLERDKWIDVQYYLKENFDFICGDTICEGEYPNIQAMSYRCSVDATNGNMGECIWTFLATKEQVRASDGKVQVDVHPWYCRSPLAPGTKATELLDALNTNVPMWTYLPGTRSTLWDGLIDCLYGAHQGVASVR